MVVVKEREESKEASKFNRDQRSRACLAESFCLCLQQPRSVCKKEPHKQLSLAQRCERLIQYTSLKACVSVANC